MRRFGRSTISVIVCTLVAMVTAGAAIAQSGGTAGPAERQVIHGGSNYNFYQLDDCDREPYGVLKNFHTKRAVITQQLRQMHEDGQDRLIIGIFHGHGLDSGTLFDSTGGDLPPQGRQNLHDLLAAVRRIGYAEVEVAFHVLGPNDPNGWTSWNEELYQENWRLIQKMRPIVAAAGPHYRLNLGNELTPAPNQPQTLEYTKRLWNDYTQKFGKQDTVGFSIIGMRPERIASIPQMYGDNPPHLFDFHFYGNETDGDEYQQFVNAHNQMNEMGYTEQGWIVGETFYNDPTSASNLRRAIDDTGRTVHYLTQWPLTRDRRCEHVTVAPPSDYTAFLDQGF